jgi:hypothetical protein
MAEDARYGLRCGVLDTVADIISLAAMQQTEAYQTQVSCVASVMILERSELNISKRAILPESITKAMSVLVQQRSAGRWRTAHTLSFARSCSDGERTLFALTDAVQSK